MKRCQPIQKHLELGFIERYGQGGADAVRLAETIARKVPDDPASSFQRWTRAEAYKSMAETYVALATRPSPGRAGARADWSAACDMFQQSHDIWVDMRRRGTLDASDAAKPDQLAQALATCQAMLRKPRDSRTP